MAISMSSATVNTSERDELLQSNINGGVTGGGEQLNRTPFLHERTGAHLAGITKDFSANVSKAIDAYCDAIDTEVERLSSVDYQKAFRGSGITKALDEFINSVKKTADSYIEKIKAAEKEIVSSVETAYQTQDSDLSGNLGSDGSTLEANVVK